MADTEHASRIAADPSHIVGQVASMLGTGNLRIQRLYQASTDGWSIQSMKARLNGHSSLLFLANMMDLDASVVGAYTIMPVHGVQDWTPVPPETFLFSIRPSIACSLWDTYTEKPLAVPQAYRCVESAHPLAARGSFTSYSSINLPGTRSYKIVFDKRTNIGADTNSMLGFENEGYTRMANILPGQLTECNITASVLNWCHQYHHSGEVWGYKFTAWSDATTRAAMSMTEDSVQLGSAAGGSRLTFDLKTRQVSEPESIEDTRAGFEASPGGGCWRYLSGDWDEERSRTMHEFEVWLVEMVEEGEDLPEARYPVISEPPSTAWSPRTLPQDEVQRLWGNVDLSESGFQQDMAYVTSYTPMLDRVNILLCGGVGAGKSTLINSLLTIFHTERVHAASVASYSQSVTRHVTKYRLESIRDDLPGFLTTCLDLWDTPGFTYEAEALTYRGGQLAYMVEGNIPDNFANLDTTPITLGTAGLKHSPTPADKMHVVLLLVNYKHLAERDSPYMARVNQFIAQMRNPASPFTQNLQPIILVSQVDMLDPRINRDKSLVFSSDRVMEYRHLASQKTGIPVDRVLPVTAYYDQCVKEPQLERLLIFILRKALEAADSHLYNLKRAGLIAPRRTVQGASDSAAGGTDRKLT